MPKPTGVQHGKLSPCPSSPNCVCSFEDQKDHEHYIKPIPYGGAATDAIDTFEQIILREKRTSIVKKDTTYLHATFTSALWRFTDDVEVLVDSDADLIHLRSASRTGYSDLGANRKRIKLLKKAFLKAQKP